LYFFHSYVGYYAPLIDGRCSNISFLFFFFLLFDTSFKTIHSRSISMGRCSIRSHRENRDDSKGTIGPVIGYLKDGEK